MLKRNLYVVYKIDKTLNDKWRRRFEAILKIIELPAFAFFIHKGYAAWFIDGIDLHGENLESKEPYDVQLNSIQRKRVIKIFRDIVYAGIKTGYTLADFTRKNIMIDGNTPYLIDYDIIIEGELNQDYINIFQSMLNYLEIDYQFDGNLENLYECLNRLSSWKPL